MEDATIRTVTLSLLSHYVSADSMARIIDTFVSDCYKRVERVDKIDCETQKAGDLVVITFTVKNMR